MQISIHDKNNIWLFGLFLCVRRYRHLFCHIIFYIAFDHLFAFLVMLAFYMMVMNILTFISHICLVNQLRAETPHLHHLTKRERRIIVTMHNVFRQRVAKGLVPNQPKGVIGNLTWDEDLAKFASYYIQEHISQYGQCPEDHNPDPCWYHGKTVDKVGENIAWITPSFFRKSIKSWFEEHLMYNYGPITKQEGIRKPKTGHYTQMIWSRSRKIGCTMAANCIKNGDQYDMMLLCNYSPMGNVIGQYPYYNDANTQHWSKWTDFCRMKEDQLGNWDRRKNELKTIAPKPYFTLKVRPNSVGIYEELVNDNLQEIICNIIKNQNSSKLGKYSLQKHAAHCLDSGMGRRPVLNELEADTIATLICKHVERLFAKEKSDFHSNMKVYCNWVYKHLK